MSAVEIAANQNFEMPEFNYDHIQSIDENLQNANLNIHTVDETVQSSYHNIQITDAGGGTPASAVKV